MAFLKNIKTVKEILKKEFEGKIVNVTGWVNTCRKQKNNTFINMSDGSTLHGIQLVAPSSLEYRYKQYNSKWWNWL